MATTTLFELVRDDLFAAFRSADVATQAGIADAVWASDTLPYVEYGDGKPKHANTGRLPHVEFYTQNSTNDNIAADGGQYIGDVAIRITVANILSEDARQSAERVLLACIKAARADDGEDEGNTDWGTLEPTNVGWSLQAVFQFARTYQFDEQGLIIT